MEVADHYCGQREELTALVAGLGPDQLATRVPACPDWTVRDLLAHLVGVTSDVLAGRMEGAPSPGWTQAQVDARAGVGVDALLEEWAANAAAFDEALAGLGFLGWVLTYDVTLHGDDLREALGLPLGSSETHATTLDGMVRLARRRAEGVPGSLRLVCGDRTWEIGASQPVAVLALDDPGELLRVLGGRRDDDAVRALPWTGDPEPWLPVLPLFRSG